MSSSSRITAEEFAAIQDGLGTHLAFLISLNVNKFWVGLFPPFVLKSITDQYGLTNIMKAAIIYLGKEGFDLWIDDIFREAGFKVPRRPDLGLKLN